MQLTQTAHSKFRMLLPTLLDVAVPTVSYYALHFLGVGDFWALAIAGLATCALAIVQTIRHRRLDAVGLLVVIEVALSLLLIFVTRNPKILLLRASAYTAVAGIYLLGTMFMRRPFMFESSKPIVAARGPGRLAAFESCWERSPAFRSLERKGTLVWGVAFLADAVLRAVVVLHVPVKQAVLLAHIPGIVVLGAALLYTRHLVPAIRRIVREQAERQGAQGVWEMPGAGMSTVDRGSQDHAR